jgi:hypothetical protein
MSDISPDSLRKHGDWLRDHRCYAEADAMDEAADEIERLREMHKLGWAFATCPSCGAEMACAAAAGGSSCS